MPGAGKRTQAERRAESRSALLEAAARGLSRYGYSSLVLERVASEAGYTRGALYHLFDGKEDLAVAVVEWVEEAWYAEVGRLVDEEADPAEILVAVARAHAVFCRRDIARVMMTLRVEFSDHDHPVGRAIAEVARRLVAELARLITAARDDGTLSPGPPARLVALAYLGAVEGLVISVAGQQPYDADLAEMAVRGLLGLETGPESRGV